jgi:tetratricopeptide (TPR) repeat protein
MIDPLAQSIADGRQVDWDSAESAAPDDAARGLVRQLAVIAAIAEIHATTAEDEGPHTGVDASGATPDMPTWGAFRLLQKVGQGAYGEVYRALDTRLDREVALKLLPAGPMGGISATTIMREGSLLARVRHPNVVDIHGAEQIGDRVGLWMEYVEGQTLEQILEQRTSLSEPEAVNIGIQVCRAVSAVHGAGLLHRDIKAQNVMRATDGRIVLLDFGAGWRTEAGSALQFAGTPLCLAPEVLRGEPATARSDIYSVGVLLYRLVTGSFPVPGRTIAELKQRHADGERTSSRQARPDIAAPLARAIDRAIDPDPTRRFPSPEAFEAELTTITRRSGIRRAPFKAGVVAIAAAALLGWAAVDRRLGQGSRPAPAAEEDWLVRGRTLIARRGVRNAQLAAELYEGAIARNPNSAAAHAGLVEAHALMSFPDRGTSFDAAFPIMQRSAAMALRLDPLLAEAHAANGWVYAFERKWTAAAQSFEEAIRLDPARTLTYTSYSISTLQSLGRYDEALRLLEVAARHDPKSLPVQREIGQVLLFAGRFAEAAETLHRVRAADPDLAFVQTFLARALIFSGRVEEVLPLWEQGSIWPAQALVRMGRRKDAEALAAEYAAYPHQAALIFAALGDTARVIEALDRAAASAPHRMGRLLNEPELAAFRDHPRVVALRQAFGLP